VFAMIAEPNRRAISSLESTVDARRRLYRPKPEPLQEVDAWLALLRRLEDDEGQTAKLTKEGNSHMNNGSKRWIFRWIHIVFGIPIAGYIYSPFQEIPKYAPLVRFVFLPVIVLSGLWMWKGHVLRRLISKRPAKQDAAENA
jgi:hypothetical protein